MITCVVHPEERNISLEFETDIERQQFEVCFNTRKIRNARFRTAKNKFWDGTVKFMKNHRLPIGFWYMIREVCTKYGFQYGFKGIEHVVRKNIKKSEVAAFCRKLMEGHPKYRPYPYQIDAVFKMVKYKHCMADLSTSAGKTLMLYMYIQYMRWKKLSSKFLIITPDADLVIQGYGDFSDYSQHMKHPLKMCMIHGGNSLSDINDYSISFGNFQTLGNRKPSFFSQIDNVIVDEGHRAKAKTITDILSYCTNSQTRLGVSGTIVVDTTADYYQLVASFGPIVKKVTKKDLMDAGKATSIKIEVKVLSYLPSEHRKQLYDMRKAKTAEGSKIYDIECKLYRNSDARLDYIAKLVSGYDGNCIVFFRDKKHRYGHRIADRIKSHSKKSVYYVDGDTPKKTRIMYMKEMENGNNKVIVANWVTFSTGKSMPSLKYAVAAENTKSEEWLGQGLGRLMRLHESMEEAIWVDIVDDFRYTATELEGGQYVQKASDNILFRQLGTRNEIYKKDQLPVTIQKVDLMEF